MIGAKVFFYSLRQYFPHYYYNNCYYKYHYYCYYYYHCYCCGYLIVMILIYILSFLLREFLHRDNLLTSFSRSIFFLVLFVYNSYHLLLE